MALHFGNWETQRPLLAGPKLTSDVPWATSVQSFSGTKTSRTTQKQSPDPKTIVVEGALPDCAARSPFVLQTSLARVLASAIGIACHGLSTITSKLTASYWHTPKVCAERMPPFKATNVSLSLEKLNGIDGIPAYVYDFAPYCYLYSDEEYWPGPLLEHLEHTTPYIGYAPVSEVFMHPNLSNLNQLNRFRNVYITSDDDPESYPRWISGVDHIPLKSSHRSSAPATLIVVDKGDYLDAFWFFFYSFNLGNQVLGNRFGNHVADWEHTAIRFEKRQQKPVEVFFSEHEWGAAYRWNDVEKYSGFEKRMLTYSAYGTHAMYRTAGPQPYVLPFGLLQDTTDKGFLWDPLLNLNSFIYDVHTDRIKAIEPSNAPVQWFHFEGRWGDKAYPNNDSRQYEFFGQFHYDSGPTGPKFKNLGRSTICESFDRECIIKDPLDDLMPRIISSEDWQDLRHRKNDVIS